MCVGIHVCNVFHIIHRLCERTSVLCGRGMSCLCVRLVKRSLSIETLMSNTLDCPVLSHSVVDRWFYQHVQTVDFPLVASITPQSKDLLNTESTGMNLLRQTALWQFSVKHLCLISVPPHVYEASEIKLGQDTC